MNAQLGLFDAAPMARMDAWTADLESAADGSQKPNGGRRVCPAEAGRHTDSAGRAYWVGKPGESLPLDPVEADEVVTAGKDRPKHPQEGANRVQHVLKAEPAGADATDREARGKVMALEGSDRPTGLGTDGAPAISAAPAFIPLARRSDPATSHAAAESAKGLQAWHHTLILAALEQRGPLGKSGIARFTPLDGVQACCRLTELQRAGLIEWTGRTVPSTAGRAEREWRRT